MGCVKLGVASPLPDKKKKFCMSGSLRCGCGYCLLLCVMLAYLGGVGTEEVLCLASYLGPPNFACGGQKYIM